MLSRGGLSALALRSLAAAAGTSSFGTLTSAASASAASAAATAGSRSGGSSRPGIVADAPSSSSSSSSRFSTSLSSPFSLSRSRSSPFFSLSAFSASFTSDAVAEDAVSPRLTDRSLLQTGAFIGGEFVDAGGGGSITGSGGNEAASSSSNGSGSSSSSSPPPKAETSHNNNDDKTYDVVNPATAGVVARVARCGGVEATVAVEEAAAAFRGWRNRPARERSSILSEWARLISENTEDLATIMSLECGKPLAEARNELSSAVDSVSWSAAEAVRVTGSVLSAPGRGRRMMTLKQPVGVAGLITPWNFPASMVTRKAAPALASGCAVVLKPAESTPLVALALAELARRAGVPAGVFNVVSGDAKAIGDAFLKSDAVRKIGFTGSTAVGRHLYEGASKTVKRLSLELGGNAPVIVASDADVEQAATAVAASAFRNAGQTCISASRVLVAEEVYKPFVEAVSARASRLRMGPGTDPATSLGPLISPAATERVRAHIDDALSKGATVAATSGPLPSADSPYAQGYFSSATVLSGALPGMRVHTEETFGPLVAAFKFKSLEEAVALANDTEYGLAAYVFTRDVSRAWRLAEALDYGMVGVNTAAVTDSSAPFGGLKHSGLGKEGGAEAINEYLDVKTVALDVGSGLS